MAENNPKKRKCGMAENKPKKGECRMDENKPKKRKCGMAENKPKKGECGMDENKPKKRKCGLCGSSKELTKTPCCKNWICDDEEAYDLGTGPRNSCYRNHSRYTLCAFHYYEDHKDVWQYCEKCKTEMNADNYVYFGTNDHNFSFSLPRRSQRRLAKV